MAQNTERSLETARAYAAGNIGGLDDAWTRRLVASVVETESYGGRLDADNNFGYYGRYQAGAGWLVDAGLVNRERYQAAQRAEGIRAGDDWTWGERGGAQRFLADPANWNNGLSLNQYLGSAALQDGAFRTNSTASYEQAIREGVLTPETDPNVVAGFLKARHIGGYGNAIYALEGGQGRADANGTTPAKYFHDIASNRDGFDQYFVPDFQRRTTGVTRDPLSDNTLSRGERGDPVRELQQKLTTAGFSTNGVDGVYGRDTESAVRRYQEANGQTVNGIAGPETLRSLGIGQQQTPAQPAPAQPTPAQPTPVQPTPTQPTTTQPTTTQPTTTQPTTTQQAGAVVSDALADRASLIGPGHPGYEWLQQASAVTNTLPRDVLTSGNHDPHMVAGEMALKAMKDPRIDRIAGAEAVGIGSPVVAFADQPNVRAANAMGGVIDMNNARNLDWSTLSQMMQNLPEEAKKPPQPVTQVALAQPTATQAAPTLEPPTQDAPGRFR